SGGLTDVVNRLSAMGYTRVPTVTEVAQFSVRGGILDVYGFGMAAPTRVEWSGDEIVSLRPFDLDSQRSGGDRVERVTILPARSEELSGTGEAQGAAPLRRQSVLDLIPTDALLVLAQEAALGQEVDRAWAEAEHHLEIARRLGEAPPARAEIFVAPEQWRRELGTFARVALDAPGEATRFPLTPPEPVDRGIQTIAVGAEGGTLEVAVVEYEGGDRLNVPLYRLDQLEPYRAAGNGDAPPPKLHRLGATTWQRQRDKTRAAIRQMAAELLDLYARRQLATGFAFPPDTPWQRELESAFLYEDTPDQRRAAEEVKRDMERAGPMDRLQVGDVGYGKTEVALRAAFKAVQAGKQVAVLAPTTILAEQHGRTFRERLADYPVRIEVLSRFRNPRDTQRVVQGLEQGTVDLVIGTHRLLSRDVKFHELGLLIVDEEHRFGVRHKERLKALKLAVDVLTLTATPIPRTLHLSLAGLRDLTLLETPPKDRSPV